MDIYEAAGIPKPSLSDLGSDDTEKAQRASNAHLAIEALRAVLAEESAQVSRHNLRPRQAPSSIKRLLVKYKYPPDKQPGAMALVIEQMESMATRSVA